MHDLWADVDQEYSQLAARAGTRARSVRQGDLLTSLRLWLQEEYLAGYCRALRQNPLYRRCYWIDALGGEPAREEQAVSSSEAGSGGEAGPGPRERSGGRRRAQSQPQHPWLQPLSTLHARLFADGRSLALYGLLLTGPAGRRSSSRPGSSSSSHKAGLVIPREGGLVSASWPEAATAILQLLDQAPAVFALNPLAPALFRYEDLEPLLQRAAPTELCLLIMHRQLESRLRAARRLEQQAIAVHNLLRSDRWRALMPRDETAPLSPEALAELLDLLLSQIQRHFPLTQRIALPRASGPALIETAPYTLLFATRRQDSLLAMNDAVCIYWRRLEEQSQADLLGSDWFQTRREERLATAREQLYQRTLQMGRALRSRRWPDLRQQLISSTFGQFTQAEHNAVIQRLLREGLVRCEWRRPRPTPPSEEADASEPVPGPDDLLIWPGTR
ncbi:MAG: hypothetical protein IMW90_21460 [Thermogemmatispora sp.]|uniref:hypothetical protein n=1 Tax=Thermogemmatispora sp. TaxID=1968838 RepID=UPI0019F87DF6|nr:hypothetical protein [Thermogemmatispora sp.]MBE3568294.1 hypothetical protein [Thermogemmatispora sp.]